MSKIEQLTAPFKDSEIQFRVQQYKSDGKALVFAYLGTDAIINRFNDVLGPMGWSNSCQFLPSGHCVMTLTVYGVDGTIAQHSGTGEPGSEGSNADKFKTAESDALKRAARFFGIGAELWSFKNVYVPYTTNGNFKNLSWDHDKILDMARGASMKEAYAPAHHSPTPQVKSMENQITEEGDGSAGMSVDDLANILSR